MSNKTVSGSLFKKMVTNGAVNLKNNHKEIDHLNVFPVPDGDTGTNMQMTMMAGIKEVNNLESQSIVDISKILSRGLLMGARGNSGVILSQFFRGVYTEISKIDNGSVNVKEFIQALVGGYQMAYRAVMQPVEGTILTVVRESAEKVLRDQANFTNIEDVLNTYLKQAKETLNKTPDLLPVLKEAGVVDSGGAGFVKIIEGMIMALEGKVISESEPSFDPHHEINEFEAANRLGDIDIKYGYCTEFIVKLSKPDKFNADMMRIPLSKMGDSLVVVSDEDLLKVHVHTNEPGVALNLGQKYGEIQTVKVENMRIQHSGIVHAKKEEKTEEKPKQKTKYGLIAVASGTGVHEAFKELGVNVIIDGGQTMNPSTEDFVKAIEGLNAENIIILPNNSNVILSAEQTLTLLPDLNIRVVKTKSIAQGYASLMSFDPTRDIDDNVLEMLDTLKSVNYGEVTYAVRDTEINGVKIKENDFIGISKNEIKVSTNNKAKTTEKLLSSLITDESEIVTIFYGQDVTQTEINKLIAFISKNYEDVEVETIDGGQDIYSYIIAVE